MVKVNDSLTDVNVEFEVEVYSLKGKMPYEKGGYTKIPKNSKEIAGAVKIAELGSDVNPPYLLILRLNFGGQIFENHYLYGCIPFRLKIIRYSYKRFKP